MKQERLSQQLRVSEVRRAKRERIARLAAGFDSRRQSECSPDEKRVAAKLQQDPLIREKLQSLQETLGATTSDH